MTSPSWESTLDAYAERLDDQRAALDAGEPDSVAPFEPPIGIGALPPDLRPRAEQLLHDAITLEAAMEASLSANVRASQTVRRFSHVSPPAPAYIDNSL